MMTREEAISIIERVIHTEAKWPGTEDTLEALDMALSALRPVSREQVERMRGEWIEDEFAISHCSLCGYEQEEPELITPFCPLCGSPMTDEAAQKVMERLEALYERNDD